MNAIMNSAKPPPSDIDTGMTDQSLVFEPCTDDSLIHVRSIV
jgi:hypothetical protein